MGNFEHELYQVIEDILPETPAPSELYHLEPIGVGTPFVESLTSYVLRLAREHLLSFSDLAKHVIIPLLGHDYLNTGKTSTNFYSSAGAMNSHNKCATEWVNALQLLTLRENLHYLTLLPLKGILANKGLLNNKRAWCPHCFEVWKNDMLPIYEPLLWKFQPVKFCTVHKSPLTDICPMCRRQSLHLATFAIPGYCYHCKKWLGFEYGYPYEGDGENDLWIANSIGEMLAAVPFRASSPTKGNVMGFFDYLINNQTKGSAYGLAKLLNMDDAYIVDWRNGMYLPAFGALIKICLFFKVSLLQIMDADFEPRRHETGSNAYKVSCDGITKKNFAR